MSNTLMVVNFYISQHGSRVENDTCACAIPLNINGSWAVQSRRESSEKMIHTASCSHICVFTLGMLERKHAALQWVPFPAASVSCSVEIQSLS